MENFWRSEGSWKAVWKSFLQILQNPQKHWKVLQKWRSRGAGIDEKYARYPSSGNLLVENLMRSHPRALKRTPRVTQRDLLGSLGAIFGAFGSVLGALGTVLGASWEALGTVLESCWSTFGGSEALGKRFGSDFCKYCKTVKNIERYIKNGGSEKQKCMKSKQDIHREAIFWLRI